ncbi:MAG: hypothetical protein ACFE8Z_06210 [Candidatus Hermodarchaeota archaeon]
MLKDPDLEKLAVASRQKLVQEFADTFADLNERARRAPTSEAERIAEKYSCSFQIASIAYLIELDGIMSARDAIVLLSQELERLALIGDPVPDLPGNVMEFALREGKWIQHLYGKFIRELEFKIREVANLESSLEDESPPIEKAVSVLASRMKLAQTFIAPLVEAWMEEHPKSTSDDVLVSFGPVITGWKLSTLRGRLNQLKRRNQAFLRMLGSVLMDTSDSATADLSAKRLGTLIDSLDKPLDQLSVDATAHLLVHVTPRPSGRGDRSVYVAVSAASTRGDKAEPDLTSPFDFLERDVRLAKRRPEEEQCDYLREKIGRVIRYLRYQGISVFDGVERCVRELEDRFKVQDVTSGEEMEQYRKELGGLTMDEQEGKATEIVLEFINKQVMGGTL